MQTPSGQGSRCRAAAAALAGLLSLAAMPVLATDPATSSVPVDAGAAAAAPGIPGIGQPLDTARLERMRGGDGTTTNQIEVDGEVSGNNAWNVTSGMNLVDGGSFGNAAGVSTVIQNSGSNVLIQNAMIVNVQFADPGP